MRLTVGEMYRMGNLRLECKATRVLWHGPSPSPHPASSHGHERLPCLALYFGTQGASYNSDQEATGLLIRCEIMRCKYSPLGGNFGSLLNSDPWLWMGRLSGH